MFPKLIFYPNECSMCYETMNIKRCNGCNMKYYCSVEHQKIDWPVHKNLCKIITTILKREKISHIFEKLRGVDEATWIEERSLIIEKLKLILGADFSYVDTQLFYYPIACFVCHDTRHEMLKYCPNCNLASFCKDHPTSPHHDKTCASFKLCHELEKNYIHSIKVTNMAIIEISRSSKINILRTSGTSMKNFLDQTVDSRFPFFEFIKYFASMNFCPPLTIYQSLQKLKAFPQSKFIIHVNRMPHICVNAWEILLHLVPDLKILKILWIGYDECESTEVPLCKDCYSKNKKLITETYSMNYYEFVKNMEGCMKYEEPDIVCWGLNTMEVSLKENEEWEMIEWSLCRRTCPLVITTSTEQKFKVINRKLETSVWGPLIIYKGLNDFGSLVPRRNWENGDIIRLNQFMIVCKSRQSETKQRKQQQNHIENEVQKTETRTKSKDSGKECHEIKTTARKIIEGKSTKSSCKKESRVKSTHSKNCQTKMKEDISKLEKPNLENVKYQSEFAGNLSNDLVDPVMKNGKSNANLLITEHPISKANLGLTKDELFAENLELKEQNKLLKENILLKEANEKLWNERLKLDQENKDLKKGVNKQRKVIES